MSRGQQPHVSIAVPSLPGWTVSLQTASQNKLLLSHAAFFCHSNKESNGHIVNLRLSSVTRNLQLQVPSFPCLSPCPLPHYHLNFILYRCQLHARYRIRCREAHTQCGILFSDDPITFPSFKFKTERKGVFASTENCFSRQGSCWSQKPS